MASALSGTAPPAHSSRPPRVREPGLFDRPLTRLVRTRHGERPREEEDIDMAFGGFDVTRIIRPESPP